jgi:hypothetical protein
VAEEVLPEITSSQLIATAVSQVSLSGACAYAVKEIEETAQKRRAKRLIFFIIK